MARVGSFQCGAGDVGEHGLAAPVIHEPVVGEGDASVG